MASNFFGCLMRVTTFGESHGEGIGAVIDGFPSKIEVNFDLIRSDMERRRPGYSFYTSPRKEPDEVKILSGVYKGKTTGAPIGIWIENKDIDSSKYETIKEVYRPGHADFSYQEKYGHYDPRGGGRASARETALRVVAGSFAKMLLPDVKISAKVVQIGEERDCENFGAYLRQIMDEGDSVGGVIECRVENLPAGLGDPIYEKLEANLAKAMLSINATRGFEIGEGFAASAMRGSEHNDSMHLLEEGIGFLTNCHGGVIAGISTGAPIIFRVAFKPTSSIKKEQLTVAKAGGNTTYTLPKGSRHDPCVALRAPVIVENMAALVLADSYLMNRWSKNPY